MFPRRLLPRSSFKIPIHLHLISIPLSSLLSSQHFSPCEIIFLAHFPVCLQPQDLQGLGVISHSVSALGAASDGVKSMRNRMEALPLWSVSILQTQLRSLLPWSLVNNSAQSNLSSFEVLLQIIEIQLSPYSHCLCHVLVFLVFVCICRCFHVSVCDIISYMWYHSYLVWSFAMFFESDYKFLEVKNYFCASPRIV